MDRKFEIMEALGGVNTYFVEESITGSPQMKDRFKAKLTTIAASVALVVIAGIVAVMSGTGFGFGNVPVTPPATSGGSMYGETDESSLPTDTEDPAVTAETDAEPGLPYYPENGKLSEMTDEELLAVVDAVTGETRYTEHGEEYRYGLYEAIYQRFWSTDDEESFRAAFVGAMRAVAKCDEAATDESFLDDTVGIEFFREIMFDSNGDEIDDVVLDNGSGMYPIKEFFAAFDIVVIRYYLEYYDMYADDSVITPELAELYISALGRIDEYFSEGTREHTWPARMFDPVADHV